MVITAPGHAPERRAAWISTSLSLVGLVLLLVAVAVATSEAGDGKLPKELVVLPALALGGLGLVSLALTRFEAFVLVLLALRSSLDAAKIAEDGVASLLNPATILALLFAASGVAWIYARRRAGARHPSSRLQTFAVAYLAVVALSAAGSLYPSLSAVELLRVSSGVAMFFVVDRLLHDERSLQRLLLAVFASALIPLLVVVFGVVTGHQLTETKEGVQRLTSTFAQSNPFGHYLLPLSLLGLATVRYVPARLRLPLGILVAAMMTTLIATFTRGAWLGLVVGLLVLAWYRNRALILGVAGVAVLVVLAVPPVSARVADLSGNPNEPRRENSLEWRLNYWSEILPLAGQNPVTGIGLGSTSQALETGKAPHNDYLRSLVELGVVGFLAYVALIVQFIRTSLRALRVARPGLQRGVALGALSYSIAFAVVSVAENMSNQVVLLWYIFTIMAMANWIARTGASAPTSPDPARTLDDEDRQPLVSGAPTPSAPTYLDRRNGH